ncbi:GHKL domain-containing protein [Bacillus sp. YZJH907-2]|uniref:GHKL domain-containing protein n=2 Tax=Halalkalibacter suaedae TaxID=2822140 RepID=A0A940X0Y7_9BACI|nr:GHKL domain-containing protein [Bacillus suaedae]
MKRELHQLAQQHEQINETFLVVRGERHDFLKHVSAIHFMLENDETPKAKAYLDDLVDGYERTNLAIKGERGSVAGVLHQMYRRASSSGVSIVYDLDVPLSTLPISDHDLVTLLGNLLSNSIDATIEWQDKYKEQGLITLQFYKRSGLYILLAKNHSLAIPTNILDKLFHTYGRTTKTGEHHGIGTKMINNIVEKNNGYLDFTYKKEEFSVKIKLPALQ